MLGVLFAARYSIPNGSGVEKMKQFTSILVILSIILTGNTIGPIENSMAEEDSFSGTEEIHLDLEDIKRTKTLKAITTYSSTNYFLYKGRPMGYQYELLERLSQDLDLDLEIIIAKDQEDAFEMLHRGVGDIIAIGLTINAENKEKVALTIPHKITRHVLVQKLPWNSHALKLHEIERLMIRDPFNLDKSPVYVSKNSSQYHRLINMQEEIGKDLNIVEIPGYMTTFEIMEKVDKGEFEFAVVDENQAKINQASFPNVDINTPISLPLRTGWAVRKSSPKLLTAINNWIERAKDEVDYYVIFNKYYKNRTFFRTRIDSKFYSKIGGEISPFDSLIRNNSQGFDWRFISSVIYQESQFNIDTSSWVGAVGLMQLMPSTAKAFGVKNIRDPEENVQAGVKYLHYLMDFWKEVPDSLQRVKFALASYNCGLAHVLDAQRLAEKFDLDPDLWDDNVEIYIRKLSEPEYFTDPVVKYGYCRGEEPYNYVRQILDRFKHYQKFIPNEKEEALMASVKNYEPVRIF